MISASAPGKAVLSGEYAVLVDAPAIAMAVDCRARVSLDGSDSKWHCLETPGYADGGWYFRGSGRGVVEWRDPLPDPAMFSLVEAVFKSIGATRWPTARIVVDTRAFYDRRTGNKLGFGSSAAVAVALSAALRAWVALDADDGRTARDAHDRFQGGRGSGVDVAASQQGGLIEFRRGATEVTRMSWPAGLHYRILWSGHAAPTVDKIKRLGGKQQATSDSMLELCVRAAEIAEAWSSGAAEKILASFPAYIDTLGAVSDEHDLGIFDAGHRALSQRANERGIVYKPCGAGGGDIGIALAGCEHDADNFCKDALLSGFSILDVSLDETGLELAE